MSTDLDLDVLPIYRLGGFEQPAMPGLHLAIPPRRTARGRAADLLILMLELKGNAPLSVNQQSHLLAEISNTYYQHRGSVTASIRAAIEHLNQILLDRNKKSAETGLQSVGLLTAIVARESAIYLAQSGPMHTFVITPGDTVHLYNAQNSGRGLGVSSTPSVHFFQTGMENGGLVLGSPAPPPTWTAGNLKASYRLRLENLHRSLINQAGPDLAAIIIKVRPGKGELHLLQPIPGRQAEESFPSSAPPASRPDLATTSSAAVEFRTETPAQPQQPSPQDNQAGGLSAPMTSDPTPPQSPVPGEIQESELPDEQAATRVHPPPVAPEASPPIPIPAVKPVLEDTAPPPTRGASAPAETSAAAERETTTGARRRSIGERIAPALLALNQSAGNAWERTTRSLRTLLGRMTPGGDAFSLPSSVMVSIAVIIPLVIVTIALTTYLRRGLAGQHEVYLERASQAASQAAEITDPVQARAAWGTTLDQVATAEAYGRSEGSDALHAQAQGALDQLDGVTRLAFQPALTRSYNENVEISRLISTPEDIYMLNAADGSVLRAWLSARGYEPDATFSCGPGVYGSITVGELIDIAPLPKGNDFNATMLALDRNGNLIYCIPGKPPIAAPLVPPDSNWGEPKSIAIDSGSLYVLDPVTNAVWLYRGANYNFGDRPSLFFTDEIPPLADVIDLAANRQDLYLLHEDGHLTTCTGSDLDVAPTRCTDPAPFSDSRPGREPEVAVIPETQFSQILFTAPPDPSVYLLDPVSQAIYHFSLRLTFQRQFQSQEPLSENPAVAFTVSPNRTVFLAIGNEVYYATIP
jgi:uncharacterized membrane protein